MIYKTETHLHTKESQTSIRQKSSAEEIVNLYKEKGYNTIIVTDHYTREKLDGISINNWDSKIEQLLTGYKTAKQFGDALELNILFGIELTLLETGSDYLIYGVTEEFLKKHSHLYDLKFEELVNLCTEHKLLIVQAHPFRDDIILAPLEHHIPIEAYNGCHSETSRNDKAIEYAKIHNLIGTSGSDFHHINDTARGGIITKEEIKNIEDYIKNIKNNTFTIITCEEVSK